MTLTTHIFHQNRILLAVLIIFILIPLCCYGQSDVMISPPGVATVCSGHQLELTCSTSGPIHEWSFGFIPNPLGISSGNPDNQTVRVNSTTFNFSRVSSEDSLPLISRLLISPVSDGLNGSSVSCMDVATSESVSTSINVIDNIQPQGSIHLVSEAFESNRVIVSLEWTRISSFHFYNVSVIPSQSVEVVSRGNTRVQLALSYNTLYNVSVVATHLCGQTYRMTNFTEICYTSCPDSKALMDISPTVIINDYSSPLLEGATITLRCPPGYEINGSNTSTCLDSGLWEPDPGEVECIYIAAGSKANDINSIGVALGISFTLLGIILLICAAIGLILTFKSRMKVSMNTKILTVTAQEPRNVENTGNKNISKHTSKRELIYAEVGQSLNKQQLKGHTLLQLDDSVVQYAHINHSLIAEKTSNFQMDNNKEIAVNLDNLLIQLRPQVSTKWYEFGKAAGVDKTVLDNYAKECAPEDCIVETVDHWLRRCEDKPTWRDVAKILKKIHLPVLASDIENVYTTGKLPIDVNESCTVELKDIQSMGGAETPPPLPPKWDEFADTSQMENHTQANIDLAVPPLPPKPLCT